MRFQVSITTQKYKRQCIYRLLSSKITLLNKNKNIDLGPFITLKIVMNWMFVSLPNWYTEI